MFKPPPDLRNREARVGNINLQGAPIVEQSQNQPSQTLSPPNKNPSSASVNSSSNSRQSPTDQNESLTTLSRPFDADLDVECKDSSPDRLIPAYLWSSFDKAERKRQQVLYGMSCIACPCPNRLISSLFGCVIY